MPYPETEMAQERGSREAQEAAVIREESRLYAVDAGGHRREIHLPRGAGAVIQSIPVKAPWGDSRRELQPNIHGDARAGNRSDVKAGPASARVRKSRAKWQRILQSRIAKGPARPATAAEDKYSVVNGAIRLDNTATPGRVQYEDSIRKGLYQRPSVRTPEGRQRAQSYVRAAYGLRRQGYNTRPKADERYAGLNEFSEGTGVKDGARIGRGAYRRE